MKLIIIDDKIAALGTILPHVVDKPHMEFAMFSKPCLALEYCKRTRVDAAFVDIDMPEINGIDFAERLIAICPHLRVVIMGEGTQNKGEISTRIGKNLVALCNKPFDGGKLEEVFCLLESSLNPKLFLRTFDAFDLFVNGVAVSFSSRKAKELLALLTDAHGSYVTMDTAIANLWANKNAELGKRLYRDAVFRLRRTLKEVGAEGLVQFERARAVINTQIAECDMWSYLKEERDFSGRYLPQYEWSITTESKLEQRKK